MISTTKPNTEGEFVTLFFPVNVNPKTRVDRAMAPCPICSPEKPKFLNGGQLIWSSAAQAIYAIGPQCSAGLLRRKLDISLNIYRQREEQRRAADELTQALKLAPMRQSWGVQVRDLAAKVDEAHASFAHDVRSLRKALNNALKASVTRAATSIDGTHLGVVEGIGFLQGSWRLLADLNAADDLLSRLLRDAGGHPANWVTQLSPSAVKARLAEAKQAERKQRSIHDRLREAHRFLSEKTQSVLGRWGASGNGPMNFSAQRTGAWVLIRTRDTTWRGPVGIPAPPPMPGDGR